MTKLPKMIYSGFNNFFFFDKAGAVTTVCFCFCWAAAEFGSPPIANSYFLSSVKNAVPFGFESLFSSDLN
jgi:hypothetical protein